MHRHATLLTVLALASSCLNPVSEGDDAGPCTACPVPDAGSAGGGCVVNSDCHKSNPDDCNAYRDMSLICYEGVCTCAGAVADAGSGGAACGLGPDAGACGPNQVCCESWGGAHPADGGPNGGPNGEGCNSLGPDGGCPEGASCTFVDGGAIASCNFYFP